VARSKVASLVDAVEVIGIGRVGIDIAASARTDVNADAIGYIEVILPDSDMCESRLPLVLGITAFAEHNGRPGVEVNGVGA